MRIPAALPLIALLFAAGCATPRAPATLEMPGNDEAQSAHLLAGYLLARGWTVQVSPESVVAAVRDGERLWLRPLLDARGMDRLVSWRQWPAAPEADEAALAAFAEELNAALNVGLFRAEQEALVFQVSLHFIDTLDPALLGAFIEHTAEVRRAVLRVQDTRQLLRPVEDVQASR